jgi:protein XagA
MKNVALCLAAAGFALGGAGAAQAAAWTQKDGGGQIIFTGVYSHSAKGFDVGGNKVNIVDYNKTEGYLLLEYGVTDDLTLILSPSVRHVGIDGGDDVTGFGYTELGGRYRVTEGNGWVFSVQGTARIPGKKQRDSQAQVGQTDEEYDVRALLGHSFKIGEADAFIDLQGGYRVRAGDPPSEYRADVTFGVRPTPKVLLLAQSFNVFSDGRGQGIFPSYRYHNAYVSGVYDIDPRWSVQLGGLATLGGKNALRERGLIAGLWYRF